MTTPPMPAAASPACDIDRGEVERTLEHPDRIVQGISPRSIYLRRYHDDRKGHDMLMRIVIEETATERVIVTVVKASRIERYLRGQAS